MIEPASVGIRSLAGPDALSVLEQSYRYDLISSEAILNRSVGSRIRFIRQMGGQREVLEGTPHQRPHRHRRRPRGR